MFKCFIKLKRFTEIHISNFSNYPHHNSTEQSKKKTMFEIKFCVLIYISPPSYTGMNDEEQIK